MGYKNGVGSMGLSFSIVGMGPWNFGQKNGVGGMDLIFVMVGVVHKLLAWVNKKKEAVGQNFGMGGMGLRGSVNKKLLKISRNLQENICWSL